MKFIGYLITWFLRLGVAVVLSFLLFSAVALLHAAFGLGSKSAKVTNARRVESTDLIKKPPEQKKQLTQRVRQMQTPKAQGRSSQGQFDMRFSPDLNVDEAAPDGDGAAISLKKQDLTAEIFEQGQVDEQAIPQHTPGVQYPQRAIEQMIQGEVEVLFVVTYQGKVTDIQIVRTPSPIFVNDVRRTVASWRFKPAKKKGIVVNQRFRKVIEFNLQ
jgi:TonB family protein